MWKRVGGFILGLALGAGVAQADDDSSADAPAGFGEAIEDARGVVLRVPVNGNGEENTDAAEVRFYDGMVDEGQNLNMIWNDAKRVDQEDLDLTGENGPRVDPRSDSSTWGWYYWSWNGWARPYYYYYYYPTYYYNYSWYYYRPYYYWNWGLYRYYYYRWWW